MEKRKIFPGFKVLAGCFIYMFFILGFNAIKTVAMGKLPEYYDCSLSSITFVQPITTIISCILSLFALPKIMRIVKPKKIMLMGGILNLIYGLLIGLMPNLAGFVLANVASGVVTGACLYAPATALITMWFVKKRELLIGINLAFGMMGVSFWQYLSGKLIVSLGLGEMYIIAGVSVCVVVFLSSSLIIDDTKNVGEMPYGYNADSDRVRENVSIYTRVSIRDFFKQGGVRLVLAATMLGDTNVMFISLYSTTYLSAFGFEFDSAASFIALLSLVVSVYTFISGYVMEKVKLKRFIILVFSSGILANLMMAVYPDRRTWTVIVLIGIGYTLGYPATSLSNYIAAPLFGEKYAIMANSMMLGCASLGNSLLLPASARIAEALGMRFLYIILACISLVTMVFYLAANRAVIKKQNSLRTKTDLSTDK